MAFFFFCGKKDVELGIFLVDFFYGILKINLDIYIFKFFDRVCGV